MARRKQPPRDLEGIRQRGGTYQIRVSAGYDPTTVGMLSDSAQTEDAAVLVRDRLQEQVGTTPRDCPAHSAKYCFAQASMRSASTLGRVPGQLAPIGWSRRRGRGHPARAGRGRGSRFARTR